MPTTQELYEKLGLREKDQERRWAAKQRLKRKEEREEEERNEPPAVYIECLNQGHYLKGDWTITTTASGKTYAKCGRCDQGYEYFPPRNP